MIVKCKAIFISRLFKKVLILEGILVLILFMTVNLYLGYLYLISTSVLLVSVIYLFYLNRYEILMIALEKDQVHMVFVNNSFYKRKDIKTSRDSITVKLENDRMLIYMDDEQQAILRRAAMVDSDWDNLKTSLL